MVTSDISMFADLRFNQLWRNHLLAFAMLNQTKPEYDEGHCAVIWHPDDTSCKDSIALYRKHLQKEAAKTLVEWPLDTLLGHWTNAQSNPDAMGWLAAFRQRYLSLNESEPAWLKESGKQRSR